MNPSYPSVSPLDTIIFDWDGTLADTLELWVEVATAGFKKRNIHNLTRQQIIRDTIVKYDNVYRLGIPRAEMLEFGKEINALFADRCKESKLQPHALALLTGLREKRKQLALFTSSGRDSIDQSLDCLGLSDYFTCTITHEDVTEHKPQPEGILRIAERLNTTLESMMIVGDTRNDILAGQRAGIRTVMYYPELHEELYDRDYLLGLNADWYIRDLRELLDIVE